ncbi:hypothetical protein HDC37_000508 [Microbacterium sp. AK009]|uniref:hypothetical protein n=1 Tax=Microbacterium sp. AK009 TaxID=2723068 RepID=UPI0015CD6319|nr:hypothetical protein [Microbacterium sp. AK009]NYF15696.1 hypothetical protein [Microbacterium sp. AK009]
MAMVTRRGILAGVAAAVAGVLAVGLVTAVVLTTLQVLPAGESPVVDDTTIGVQLTGAADADPGRDAVMAWLARGILLLALTWGVIGMFAARTRLVRRPGAAAARASWLGSTRPWRARESTLGLLQLDKWLLILVPGALLLGTRAVQTSFLSWVHLAVVMSGWCVAVLVLRALVGARSPWPVLAAAGGAVVLRCVWTLIPVAIGGPAAAWSALWTEPVLRWFSALVAAVLLVWVFVAAAWALVMQVGPKAATGFVLAAIGAGLALPALVIGIVGGETVAEAWAASLAPLGGLADPPFVWLEFPVASAWWAATAGGVLCVVGAVLAIPGRGAGGSTAE